MKNFMPYYRRQLATALLRRVSGELDPQGKPAPQLLAREVKGSARDTNLLRSILSRRCLGRRGCCSPSLLQFHRVVERYAEQRPVARENFYLLWLRRKYLGACFKRDEKVGSIAEGLAHRLVPKTVEALTAAPQFCHRE